MNINKHILFVLFFISSNLFSQVLNDTQINFSFLYGSQMNETNLEFLKNDYDDDLFYDFWPEGYSLALEILSPTKFKNYYYVIGGILNYYEVTESKINGGGIYLGIYRRTNQERIGIWGKICLSYFINNYEISYTLKTNETSINSNYYFNYSNIGGIFGFGLYFKYWKLYLNPGITFWFSKIDNTNINLFSGFDLTVGLSF